MLVAFQETAIELANEWLEAIRIEIIAYLDQNNRNATGKSKASLQITPATNGTQLVGSKAIYNVLAGRPPGKMPPIADIIEWLNARGLPRQMAWPVAHNIAKAGTELYRQGGYNDNILTQTITQDRVNELTKNISLLYATQISSEIRNILK